MTNLKDEQLMLDAAAISIDLLWSWAAPHSGGARRTTVRDSKVGNCTGPVHAPPRCQLMHGTMEVWCQLEPGARSIVPLCHTVGPSVL